MNTKTTTAPIAIAAIIAVVIFAGCITLPSPDASPSEIVETFASWHGKEDFGACYFLISTAYKNSTDKSTFNAKMRQCDPHWTHYEFIEVITGSEKIEGDSASVEVVYAKKKDFPGNLFDNVIDKPKNKTKTINLVKEEGGWRLTDLHCELKG